MVLNLLLVSVLDILTLLLRDLHFNLHLLDHSIQLFYFPLQGLNQSVLFLAVFVRVLNDFMLNTRRYNLSLFVHLLNLDLIMLSLSVLQLLVLRVELVHVILEPQILFLVHLEHVRVLGAALVELLL